MHRTSDPAKIRRRIRHLGRRIDALLTLRLLHSQASIDSPELDERIEVLKRRKDRLEQTVYVGGSSDE